MDILLTLEMALFLFSVALTAGFVDAIAGGGGLITVPALLAAGLPPAQALATNKLQSTGGSLSASIYFISRGLVNLRELKLAIALTFFGSALGTVLVQLVSANVLQQLIPFLMVVIAAYFMFSPTQRNDKDTRQRISLSLFSCSVAMLIGFYDGFFGPGTGSFFAIAFVTLLGYSLTKATAHTKVLNCTSNIASLLLFIIGGKVVWTAGLLMLLGQFLGARLGARVVTRSGHKVIRPMIVLVSLVMTAKLLWDQYSTLFF